LAEAALDRPKPMVDLGAHAALEIFGLLTQSSQSLLETARRLPGRMAT